MRFYITILCDDPREVLNTEDTVVLRGVQDALDLLEEKPARFHPGAGFRLSDGTEYGIRKLED